ncbi:hypothetical protein RISK_004974 [Rhodopirellula islandica]|uniref:Uncharacterized protein n=1 Tax=Rhodopirellula islandica TaxID=595434 RepID=A0A0J1EBT1_RHOIS|nr:hypothetical protein RISK_004974 [Rhodopirellula islandica]
MTEINGERRTERQTELCESLCRPSLWNNAILRTRIDISND